MSKATTEGGLINITGNNFGGEISEVIVLVNNKTCNISFTSPNGPIVCDVAPGTGKDLEVKIDVGGQIQAKNAFSYNGMYYTFFSCLIFFLLFLLTLSSTYTCIGLRCSEHWWSSYYLRYDSCI